MDKNVRLKRIVCEDAPQAVGPYSQAVMAGGLVFVSGQIPVDPITGALTGGAISAQTTLVIGNIGKILKSCGSSLENVIKVEVFLGNIDHYGDMNEAYAKAFGKDVKPARSVVETPRLPKGAGIEISCVALAKNI